MHTENTTYTATSTKQIPVHKKDAEGILLIDHLTGMVVTDQMDRPEWATEQGLVCAQLAEHTLWLTNTFGPDFAQAHAHPDMFAFEALGWLTFQVPEGAEEPVEGYIEADREHRMDVVATILGIDRTELDLDTAFANVPGIVASVEIGRDNSRTDAEMEDFRSSQEGRFSVVEGGKTGTNG